HRCASRVRKRCRSASASPSSSASPRRRSSSRSNRRSSPRAASLLPLGGGRLARRLRRAQSFLRTRGVAVGGAIVVEDRVEEGLVEAMERIPVFFILALVTSENPFSLRLLSRVLLAPKADRLFDELRGARQLERAEARGRLRCQDAGRVGEELVEAAVLH